MANDKAELLISVESAEGCMHINVAGKDGGPAVASAAMLTAAAQALLGTVKSKANPCGCDKCGAIGAGLEIAIYDLNALFGLMVDGRVTEMVHTDLTTAARH